MWKHHLTDYEVRETLANYPQFRFVEKGKRKDEDVYSALGQTDAGRYVIVFFIYKLNQNALIISARDMKRKERQQYVRR